MIRKYKDIYTMKKIYNGEKTVNAHPPKFSLERWEKYLNRGK